MYLLTAEKVVVVVKSDGVERKDVRAFNNGRQMPIHLRATVNKQARACVRRSIASLFQWLHSLSHDMVPTHLNVLC
jgi:hypothetical protein